MNVFIIGMMGSGKTTVGTFVSKKLGYEFIDTDWLIQKSYGSINEIFKNSGEEEFRYYETKILKEILENSHSDITKNRIISTGGGIILSEQNRELIKENGIVVFLNINLETIFLRISDDSSRPLLDNLENIYASRQSFYKESSNYEIRVDNMSVEEVSNELISLLKC